jgi:hypothetical protein
MKDDHEERRRALIFQAVEEAVLALSPKQEKSLLLFGDHRIRVIGRAALGRTGEDLLREALLRILQGRRNWNKDARDLVTYLRVRLSTTPHIRGRWEEHMGRWKRILTGVVVVLGLSGGAGATLIDRGGGMIYDDDLNITWFQDANYVGGPMTWHDAKAWAESLVYGGYDDWRLPATVAGPLVFGYDGTTTAGFNITTSEMGHLFHEELGNVSYFDTFGNEQPGWGLANVGPFTNLQPYVYWSGTESSDWPGLAWYFIFDLIPPDPAYCAGYQTPGYEYNAFYALPVRDGDVASPVPEPGTMLLLGSGIVALIGTRKFRKKG